MEFLYLANVPGFLCFSQFRKRHLKAIVLRVWVLWSPRYSTLKVLSRSEESAFLGVQGNSDTCSGGKGLARPTPNKCLLKEIH